MTLQSTEPTPFGANDSSSGLNPIDVVALLEEHTLEMVWDSHCDYDAEVRCVCDWRGTPAWYTEHLLFMLGLTSTMTKDWLAKFVGTGNARQYADLFDTPLMVKARKTIEKKRRNAERKTEKLRRRAANGDAEAQAQLGLR